MGTEKVLRHSMILCVAILFIRVTGDAGTLLAANPNPVRTTIVNMERRFEQNEILFERLFGGYRKIKELAPPSESVAKKLDALEKKMSVAYQAGDKGEAIQPS